MPNLSPELASLGIAPKHFDTRIPWWIKALLLLGLTAAAFAVDVPVTNWVRDHQYQIWDIASNDPRAKKGDVARDLMWIEQFGHFACTIVAVLLVATLDPAGRRRALAVALACIAVLITTHLLKDTFGRARPNTFVPPGGQPWGGPSYGFKYGAAWGSFPSAHTTAAFGLASALSWFYPRARALFMAVATLTAAQRVLHQAHYLSDTLFGLAVSVFVARLTLRLNLAGRLIALAPPTIQKWWLT